MHSMDQMQQQQQADQIPTRFEPISLDLCFRHCRLSASRAQSRRRGQRSVSNIELQSIRHGDRRIRAGLRVFDRVTGKWYVASFVAEVFEDSTIVSGTSRAVRKALQPFFHATVRACIKWNRSFPRARRRADERGYSDLFS